jgi:hypothetical protein
MTAAGTHGRGSGDEIAVERAANAAAYYSMLNSGQMCVSIERVYVEDAIYDFVGRVVAKASVLRQGRSTGAAAAEVGAMTTAGQLAIVERHRGRCDRQGRACADRWPARRVRRPVLRADGARRRRPHDAGDDRRDLRPDAADHAGRRR